MKLYRNIIIVVIILAVLGGAIYFVSNFQSDTTDESAATQSPQTDVTNVYHAEMEDVLRVHIKNSSEEYTLEKQNGKWVLNGDATIRLKQTSVESVIYACTSVSVKQTVANAGTDAQKYGFANPLGFAKITFKDNSVKTITVGSLSLDKENYYIMLSDDPNIYLKNIYGTESIIPESITLRDMVLMQIDSSDLSNLRHFYMEKKGNTAVKMEYTNVGTSDDPKMQWKMIAPVYAEMNGQVFTDRIVGKLENFSAVAVIEDHPKDLSVYGLDAPYATFSVGDTDGVSSFKIGNEVKSYRYCMENGYSTVYLVKVSDLTFLDTAYMDLMSNLIHVEYIDTVNRVEIIAPEKTYQMEIKESNGETIYYINQTKTEKEAFSKAYQAVIGISLDTIDLSKEPNIRPEAQIVYHKKDGSLVHVEFLPVDERNYRVIIDGKGNSVTNKKNFTDMLKKLEETIKQSK